VRSAARGVATIIVTAARADPWRLLAVLFLTVFGQLSMSIDALFLKLVVDAVLAGDRDGLLVAVVGLSLAFAVGLLAIYGGFTMGITLEEKNGRLLDERTIALAAGVPGIEHHERPDYLDEIEMLRTERGVLGAAPRALVGSVAMVGQVLLTGGLLASVHPALLLLPLAALPSLAAAALAEQWRQKAMEQTTEGIRHCRHLYELATQASPGKELRIFGLRDELDHRHAEVWDGVDAVRMQARTKGTLLTSGGWLVFALGYVAAMTFVIQLAVAGRATPGQVILALSLSAQVNAQVTGVAGTVVFFAMALKTVGRYLWLVDYGARANTPVADPAPVPDRMAHGIDIEGVDFGYPGTDTPVLAGVDLHIPAGSTVAIVGENGAGKTTLVKLLCRFYEPTRGRILVDGVPLARFEPDEWRQRLSAGFQDFAKLEFIARESVGVGRLDQIDSVDDVMAALARASADEVPRGLPDGLDTQLGKNFADGVELSGGQWQKLALGRAMMRDGPLLLVLDEPTASLDPQTEHALFVRYAGAANEAARRTGGITVLVSHRFSTVRMADLIVVVDGGRVVEVGSHAELVARGGLYAELYELQARAYR
jgi:ATP-binding cassette subfamily B protein